MYYVILITTGQYKTRTAVGRPHLVHSLRFIRECPFYTHSIRLVRVLYLSQCFIPSLQSAVRSPCFILTGILRFWTVYIDSNVERKNRFSSPLIIISKLEKSLPFYIPEARRSTPLGRSFPVWAIIGSARQAHVTNS